MLMEMARQMMNLMMLFHQLLNQQYPNAEKTRKESEIYEYHGSGIS